MLMNLPLNKINDWKLENRLDDRMVHLIMNEDDKGYIYSEVYLKNEDIIKYELHISRGGIDHENIWFSEADEEGGWFEMEQISKEEAFEKRGFKEVWRGIWIEENVKF